MKTPRRPDHHALADALRRRVLEGPGKTDPALRQAVALSATGGPPAQPPYDALARRIGEAANRMPTSSTSRFRRETNSIAQAACC